jgi:hypothetical protein
MHHVDTDPDQHPLGALQAARLAALADLPASELEGRTIAELSERLRWIVDPGLWLFERVCGQVVKTDPVSGADFPVPNATVEVFDTVCDYWGFFPEPWPWGWLFPVRCERELIVKLQTDECGNFCFWIPRFEIEWILRWREERLCFSELLVKPSLADLLARLSAQAPAPSLGLPDLTGLVQRLGAGGDLAATLGARADVVLNAARDSGGLGDNVGRLAELVRSPAFTQPVPPPLPSSRVDNGGEAVDDRALAEIDPARFFGPFLRCIDVFVPEWYPLVEVPDVSISVTQAIAGSSQTIYEGAFDIAWGSSPIAPVTVQASPIAIASQSPCPPPSVNSDEVGFQYVGLLPVSPPYAGGGTFDGATGFATRVNQPQASAVGCPPQPISVGCSCDQTDLTVAPSCPATAPFYGELYLYGGTDPSKTGASYYRISAESAPGSGLPTTPTTFTPIGYLLGQWTVPAPSGEVVIQSVEPAEGWFEIPTDEVGWGGYANMLMAWDGMGDGVYRLTLELADAAMKPITLAPASEPLLLVVDNTAPKASPFEVSWQPTSAVGGPIDPLAWLPVIPPAAGECPIIHTKGQAIALRFTASVQSAHLLRACVSVDGCGGVSPTPASSNPPESQWYAGSDDPSATGYGFNGVYYLEKEAPAGCYTFSLYADTRAFDPAGGGSADPVENGWCVTEHGPYTNPSIPVAIVE